MILLDEQGIVENAEILREWIRLSEVRAAIRAIFPEAAFVRVVAEEEAADMGTVWEPKEVNIWNKDSRLITPTIQDWINENTADSIKEYSVEEDWIVVHITEESTDEMVLSEFLQNWVFAVLSEFVDEKYNYWSLNKKSPFVILYEDNR